jgi:site-specific recombinase XerD
MTQRATMTAKVDAYLSFRRSLGFQLRIEGAMLRQFAAYADAARHRGPLTTELALKWARATPSTDRLYWARRLEVVRCFARYLAATEPGTEIPARGLLGAAHRRNQPHIFSSGELTALMVAAGRLSPPDGLRPHTYQTLLGLLAAAGLRISEALCLACPDVDLEHGRLTIRETKFRKTRWVPLHPSATVALHRYSEFRNRLAPRTSSNRFFVNHLGLGLPYSTVQTVFSKLCTGLGITGGRRRPHLHDMRHTFACRRVETWAEAGVDLAHAVAALSVYLGHAKVSDTYWYLTATPDLLGRAAARFEIFARPPEAEVAS